jgi:hypothetical protein
MDLLLLKLWTVFVECFKMSIPFQTSVIPLVNQLRQSRAAAFWCSRGKTVMILFDEAFQALRQRFCFLLVMIEHLLLFELILEGVV